MTKDVRNFKVQVRDKVAPVFVDADLSGELQSQTVGYWANGDNVDDERFDVPRVSDNSELPVELEWTKTLVNDNGQTQEWRFDYTATDASINENKSYAYKKVFVDLTTGTNDVKGLEKNILGNNYPDPVKEYTTIPYNLKREGNVDLIIYDATGRQISSKKVYGNAGENEERLETSGLAPGMYIIKAITDDGRYGEEKFVK